MREFRPPLRPSIVRLVLAIVLPIIAIVPVGAVGYVAVGMGQATYTIADGELVVRSGDLFSGDRSVRLASITEMRLVMLSGGRRTAGTAFPGLCAGRFWYPSLGDVWQATSCAANGVLVRVAGDELPIVMTPPDPADFAARLRDGTKTMVTLPPPDPGPIRILAIVLPPLLLIPALMVAAMLLWGPGRMVYRVGDGALEVRTIFGRKRWPTAGARARPYSPSRMLRVGGSAAPGYYTGAFREAGQGTRVYATDVEQTLLFEGEQRVILSPEDRDGMLHALAMEGVTVERVV